MSEQVLQPYTVATTSLVAYHSAGNCLIIGPVAQAVALLPRVANLHVTIVEVSSGRNNLEKQLTEDGVAVFSAPNLQLTGYLGAFVVSTDIPESGVVDLAVSVATQSGAFDLVLDLSAQPFIPSELPPFGYFWAADSAAVEQALQSLPELVGEFEKPKYFDYQPRICAHSRSQITACSNCIDSCSTGAIQPDGEGIRVEPYLCQGCGSCATVCPSGALTYAYPKPSDAIAHTRSLFDPGIHTTLLLYNEAQQAAVDTAEIPDTVLTLLVEEVSAYGIDYWASMIAAGVQHVLLLSNLSADDRNRVALTRQSRFLHQLLGGLGITDTLVQLLDPQQLDELSALSAPIAQLAALQYAHFATHNDKRQTVRLAVDTLMQTFPPVAAVQALGDGAPFGHIVVDQSACTLCMACVSICPGKALLDGQDTPALRLIEANCVQCGMCLQACPESAITLEARYRYDSLAARRIETLKAEAPFHCIRCHKAFATAQLIDTMLAKLEGHWMFRDEAARQRLKMCDDCRVKDIFDDNKGGIAVHRSGDDS